MIADLRTWIPEDTTFFTDPASFRETISTLLKQKSLGNVHTTIGTSEQGRALDVFHFGRGPTKVVLMAGAHSDEPVGPETLRMLCHFFAQFPDQFDDLLGEFQFFIFPHINPDGEAVNWRWIKEWPDIKAYLAHSFREEPGRDMEFGYPALRKENRLISDYLREHAPFELHINLHGMAYSEGAMLLIDKYWAGRSEWLQNAFLQMIRSLELPLHDHDRKGEKGFSYLGPGLNTTPESGKMRRHFLEQDDEKTASLFHMNSMEYIRSISSDPMSLVTELPLFHVKRNPRASHQKGIPDAYLAFKERVPKLKALIEQGRPVDNELNAFTINPFPLSAAVQIQLGVLEKALDFIQK